MSQTEREIDQIEEDKNSRIGALKLLSSLQEKVSKTSGLAKRGLMYVDSWINQKPFKSTMVDSSVTHNFITEAEARWLNLRWEKDTKKMKVVNSAALPIVKLVKWVMIRLGAWDSLKDLVVIRMDNFDVVLGV